MAGVQFLADRIAVKKIGNDASTAEHSQNYYYLLQEYEKNSNIAVFEIANNFIAGIPFLAHTLAVKKLATMQVPRNTPKTTLICSQNTKKILISPFLRSPLILFSEYNFKHID